MTPKITEAQIATMTHILLNEINDYLHTVGSAPTDHHDGDTP